jgi:hypothetical protein
VPENSSRQSSVHLPGAPAGPRLLPGLPRMGGGAGDAEEDEEAVGGGTAVDLLSSGFEQEQTVAIRPAVSSEETRRAGRRRGLRADTPEPREEIGDASSSPPYSRLPATADAVSKDGTDVLVHPLPP